MSKRQRRKNRCLGVLFLKLFSTDFLTGRIKIRFEVPWHPSCEQTAGAFQIEISEKTWVKR